MRRSEGRYGSKQGFALKTCRTLTASLFYLLIPISLLSSVPARAQFTSSAPSPAVAPVSQAFTDGFMDGHRTMGMNIGAGHSSISKPHASTGKGDLGDASADLREIAKFVEANWDKADDSGRGKVEGEIEAVVQLDQIYAGQMSQSTGIAIPNHTTEPGYFSAPGHLNGDKAHALKLVTDTASQLDTLNGDIAGDPAKKTGLLAKVTDDDSHAAAFIPFYNAVHMGNRGKHEAEKATIANNNQTASSIKSATDNLANILMPSGAIN